MERTHLAKSIRLNVGLKRGDTVRVKDFDSILETLDNDGMLDRMPFMPEMRQYCGREFRVESRADKTCDTVYYKFGGGRRLFDTVHLEDLRCDGSGHDSCQAACLIFWKEAWLEKVADGSHDRTLVSRVMSLLTSSTPRFQEQQKVCTEQTLSRRTRFYYSKEIGEDAVYRCQLREIPNASHVLRWWDIRQYIRELASGNVSLNDLFRGLSFTAFRRLLPVGPGYSVKLRIYNWLQERTGRTPWPYFQGSLIRSQTDNKEFREGETVRVREYDAIVSTLDKRNRNRGMSFGPEMVPYCGKKYRVRTVVRKIIDESTGKMLQFRTPSYILHSVTCQSKYSHCRMYCPRKIYPFWREVWLDKTTESGQ